jgi:hypothetical protein
MSTDKVEQAAKRMMHIFQGRTDVYGGDEGRAIYRPLNIGTVMLHLLGNTGVGVYPYIHTDSDPIVYWGCCDIDTGDWSEAYMLAVALQGMGLKPWVERSRSKGWHIWIFVDQGVTPAQMRRCLKVAYQAIGLPAKEANPKSETLRPNQLGNYVRLPYKGGWHNHVTRQCMMIGWGPTCDGGVFSLQGFLGEPDDQIFSDRNKIIHWANKWYQPPSKFDGVLDLEAAMSDEQTATLVAGLPYGVRYLWENGPKEADRSATLQALAYNIARLGVPPVDCFWLIKTADRMWGKYHLRVDGDGYLADICERAYK